jgi:hypothetical protein
VLPEKFWDWLESEWKVLKSAPFAFGLVLVLGLAGGFVASDHLGSREVASAKQESAAARQERDLYKSKLQGATPEEAAKQLADLQARVTALSAAFREALTVGQISDLAGKIRGLGDREKFIVVQCPSPRQCGKFADSLEEAFRKADWYVQRRDNITQRPGLWLLPYDEGAKALQRVLMAGLGTQVFIDDQMKRETVQIQGYWLAIGEKIQ